jgi:hypothetical protein
VNGRYEPRSLAVRRTLQHLFERNAYYAKVEVMALLDDPDRAARVLGDFLGAALGDVERALPDWSVVTAAQPAGD